MHLSSTIAFSATVLAQLGASLPVASWNSTGNATQEVSHNNGTSLNTTSAGNSTSSGNGTSTSGLNATLLAAEDANNVTGGKLPIELVNHIDSDNVHAYISGLDEQGELVFLDENSQWFYPKAEGGEGEKTPLPDHVKHKLGPQFSTTKLTMPDYISSSRIWFADGTLEMFVVTTPDGQGLAEPSALNHMDPNNVTNWGFVELTNSRSWGLYANLSFVDFIGMALGMKLKRHGNETVQEIKGVPTAGKHQICDDLKEQAKKDGQPWDQLCFHDENGELMRVISPAGYLSSNQTAFEDYWYPYTNETSTRYSSDVLTIDTQSEAGKVECTWKDSTNSSNNAAMELHCDGDNRPFPPPSAEDIFGCNTGPFAIQEGDNDVHKAIVPRLCAAYNRGTLLINGGNVQPSVMPDEYYQGKSSRNNRSSFSSKTNITPGDHLNWYSKIVHQNQIDHKGYAFSYDDVAASEDYNVAGTVTGPNPELLTIIVGGYEDIAAAYLNDPSY